MPTEVLKKLKSEIDSSTGLFLGDFAENYQYEMKFMGSIGTISSTIYMTLSSNLLLTILTILTALTIF